jgi:hypothetical protein
MKPPNEKGALQHAAVPKLLLPRRYNRRGAVQRLFALRLIIRRCVACEKRVTNKISVATMGEAH